MIRFFTKLFGSVAFVCGVVGTMGAVADDTPETPRIDSVVMADPQPHESDEAVVWYDDFDEDQQQERYAEKSGETTGDVFFGGSGKSLPMRYPKGSRGIGNRKVFFGDSPAYSSQAVRSDTKFADVYWRIYVKHQHGWMGGGPAKLSRATSLVPPGWRQAMIAHVWSSGEALTLDPASGVRSDRVVTTKYNDFDNLTWLGNKPTSKFQLHSTGESGRWVCVEARAKLNTPGERNGLNQLWIDGRLEAQRRELDWRGNYTAHTINAVFLEAYWNDGSPVDQSRWIDNFVISSERVGPIVCPVNPVLIKTPYRGPGTQASWEVQLATRSDGKSVIWRSRALNEPSRVKVGTQTGQFVGQLSGSKQLRPYTVYYARVRQKSDTGEWSAWSAWHQPFQTE